ncbi:MAG TPA: four helix bundle protein [Pyrinomonadaceae bacterium]|nr:four helix bundle protein [Pyrinomonadaceae bacterium]
MRPHEKLDAWSLAMDFVVEVYKATETFPKEEKFGLTSQIRRAAVSVPANIAEGAARQSDKEFVHFLSNAQGSASELDTELIIACRLSHISDGRLIELRAMLDKIGRLITGLSQHLKRKAQ